MPWNELFILRCVFPVESVLAYGELHVEKLLCRIAYQLHVRVEASTPSPVPCKISDRVLYTESITFFPRFFLFFFSLSLFIFFRRQSVRGRVLSMRDENTDWYLKFVTNILIVFERRRMSEKVCLFNIFIFNRWERYCFYREQKLLLPTELLVAW